ncbi:CNH domain-containing protein [Entamoeba marina]
MTLLPTSFSCVDVFPSPPQLTEITSCSIHSTNSHLIIASIRLERTTVLSPTEITNDITQQLYLSVESSSCSFQDALPITPIHKSETAFCAIDIHGKDVIVVYSDLYYFSYPIIKNNSKPTKLRPISDIKLTKLEVANYFTIASHNGLMIGIVGTTTGNLLLFNINTGVLFVKYNISKYPITSIQQSHNYLFVQSHKKGYLIQLLNIENILLADPILLGDCTMSFCYNGEIGLINNRQLQLWRINIGEPTLLNTLNLKEYLSSKSSKVSACCINDFLFLFDSNQMTIHYKDSLLFSSKCIGYQYNIFPFVPIQIPKTITLNGIVSWSCNGVIKYQPTTYLEQIITPHLMKESNIENQILLCNLLHDCGTSKRIATKIAHILVKDNPMKAHFLLKEFNLFIPSIYENILKYGVLNSDEWSEILLFGDTHSEESSIVADLVFKSFIQFIKTQVLFNRQNALLSLSKHSRLFWRYILELLLLCEMEVLTTYCKVVSETSVNVVDPQLFITSLIKTLPKSIFIILETPTLLKNYHQL